MSLFKISISKDAHAEKDKRAFHIQWENPLVHLKLMNLMETKEAHLSGYEGLYDGTCSKIAVAQMKMIRKGSKGLMSKTRSSTCHVEPVSVLPQVEWFLQPKETISALLVEAQHSNLRF